MKFDEIKYLKSILESPPSRGAWIEIMQGIWRRVCGTVAPLAGGVD